MVLEVGWGGEAGRGEVGVIVLWKIYWSGCKIRSKKKKRRAGKFKG